MGFKIRASPLQHKQKDWNLEQLFIQVFNQNIEILWGLYLPNDNLQFNFLRGLISKNGKKKEKNSIFPNKSIIVYFRS